MNKISTANRSLEERKLSYRFPALRNLDNLRVFVLLSITIWIAYFWHSASFGLYWDDLNRILDARQIDWFELKQILQDHFLFKLGKGRPFHDGSIFLLSFIGFRLGGLHIIYGIGYVVLTVNSFLFYALLKRFSDQQVFAVTGALAFCLFPAHTVQAWLTIALGVQPSLMLLLIAIHCYLSERKKWSYLFVFGSLLCYETFFPLFLAVPLFKQKWNSKLRREVIKNGLVIAGILICVVLLRKLTGDDGRVSNLNPLDAIETSIRHMYVGPTASLKTFLTRPFISLRALGGKELLEELLIFLPLCFAGLFWVISQLKISLPRDKFLLKTTFDSKFLRLKTAELFDPLAKLALIGIIMLVLAYPLTLIGDPYFVDAGESRIHLAGVVGASILIGCIFSIIFLIATLYGRKRLATVGLAAYFALLVGFGLIVQQDYRLAWQYQRQYWNDMIELIPDLAEETVLFIDPTGLRNPKYMTMVSAPVIIPRIYQFPDDWEIDKGKYAVSDYILRLVWGSGYLMKPNWRENIVVKENSFQIDRSVVKGGSLGPDRQRNVESSKVILLEIKNGRLTRRTEPLTVGGKEFSLKQKTATGLPAFEKTPRYNFLIQPPG